MPVVTLFVTSAADSVLDHTLVHVSKVHGATHFVQDSACSG